MDKSSLEHKVNSAEAEIKLRKQKYLHIEKEKQDLLQEMLQEKEMFNSCKQENEFMKNTILLWRGANCLTKM